MLMLEKSTQKLVLSININIKKTGEMFIETQNVALKHYCSFLQGAFCNTHNK